MRSQRLGGLLWMGVMAAGLSGCHGEPVPGAVVQGNVTWEGKSLDTGNIVFESEDRSSHPVQTGISAGKYHVRVEPGVKVVRIHASRETDTPGEYGGLESESYIPDKYNRTSVLRATLETGSNKINFDLTSE